MRNLKTWWQARSLQADDPTARASAVAKLAESKDKAAVTALIEALGDTHPYVRAVAAGALGGTGDNKAVVPLAHALLIEPEQQGICAMIEALRQLNSPAAVEALLPFLDDEEARLRQAAANGIHEIGWDCLSIVEKVRVSLVHGDWDQVVALGGDAVEPLVRAFRRGTQHNMRSTAEALGLIEASQASAALVKLLVDPKLPRVGREIAAWALHRFRGDCLPKNVAAWVCVTDGDWFKARDFGELAVEPLRFALHDDRREVRQAAAATLKKIGGAKAKLVFRDVLRDHTADVAIREIAAAALGKAELHEADVTPALIEALKDDAWAVREAAARSLRRLRWIPAYETDRVLSALALQEWEVIAALGEAAIEPLLQALHFQSVGPLVARALVNIGDRGTNALIAALHDPDLPMSSCEVVAQTLVEIGDPRAQEAMRALLCDSDIVIRQVAVWALERMGWKPTTDAEHALVAVAHEDWDALPILGAPAAEALLALAEQGLAQQETLDALCELLAASASKLTTDQLRTIAGMPDIKLPGVSEPVGRELRRASAKARQGQALHGATNPAMPVNDPNPVLSGAASADGSARQLVIDCAAARQLARVELSRRGVMV